MIYKKINFQVLMRTIALRNINAFIIAVHSNNKGIKLLNISQKYIPEE